MRSLFSFLCIFFFLAIATLFGSSCANIVPPNGGPRDSIPPRLISAAPKDSTLNFRGEKITFTFDEYVDLQDVPNNLIFSPLFSHNPRVEVKNKNITVNFQDSLEPNTTYIFNFGSAIRDYNEGNILKDFTYTFSTGPALDSLELSGRVLLAQTGKIDSTLTVVLHRNLTDSAVRNQRPVYAVRVDAQGRFRFRNLPSGRFAIYALGDAGTARRYQSTNQLFAFADSGVTVRPGRDSASPIVLYAYRETQPTPPGAGPAQPTTPRGANRLIFTTNQTNNQQDLLNNLQLTFTTPLRTLDSTQLRLTVDSTFTNIPYSLLLDSTKKLLTIRSQWRESSTYHLILNRDFAADTAGRRLLKSDTLTFNTRKSADYGSLTIRTKSADTARNPVLQLVQNEQVVFSTSLKSGRFQQKLFLPGEYEVRILYDRNGNGKWDGGKFFGTKQQPELVQTLDRKLVVKGGGENEFDL